MLQMEPENYYLVSWTFTSLDVDEDAAVIVSCGLVHRQVVAVDVVSEYDWCETALHTRDPVHVSSLVVFAEVGVSESVCPRGQ